MKFRLPLFLAALVLAGLQACSSVESDTTTSGTAAAASDEPVPGEVNPNAGNAAQAIRSQPGWNF